MSRALVHEGPQPALDLGKDLVRTKHHRGFLIAAGNVKGPGQPSTQPAVFLDPDPDHHHCAPSGSRPTGEAFKIRCHDSRHSCLAGVGAR